MNYKHVRDNRNDSQALRDAEILKGKGKKGNFKKNGKQVADQVKKPKSGPKPETKCFYYKGTGHWKWNYPKWLADKKDGKVNISIFDIHDYWCVLY